MKASRPRVIPWADVFELRYSQDYSKPLHVQVVEVGSGVPHVRQGDELFLHEITSDEISLKPYTSRTAATDRRNSEGKFSSTNDELMILLPRQYDAGFTLCPRYPLSHCFQTVREIIDALPAVSRIFYPVEGLSLGPEQVKPMERLEIVEAIRDPLTGSNLLSVRSMKTEAQMLLPANLRAPFVQLSSECIGLNPSGPGVITAFECIVTWKPGQPPYQVKLCPPSKEEKNTSLKLPKQTKLKRDKKDKKKKHASWGDFENFKLSELQSEPNDRWLIPESWREKTLFMKPFQKIRVQNVMFNSKDFFLPENAKVMVKVLSADTLSSPIERNSSPRNGDRISGPSEAFSGPLYQLPTGILSSSKGPLVLLITEGEMATSLRQRAKISVGSRLAIHRKQHSTKILMECERGQKFIVGLSYAGVFQKLSSRTNEPGFPVKAFLSTSLPCEVRVTREDKTLGYDQLSRRTALTAVQILQDTTLHVEIVGADGHVLSEHPFEIPLCRTTLSVKVVDKKSVDLTGCVPMHRLRLLPSVEFITESQLEILRKWGRGKYDLESNSIQKSPEFPARNPQNHLEQRADHIYTKSSKANENTAGSAFSFPPPRPPKSPSLTQQKFQIPETSQDPPRRPPKPDKYRDMPVGYQYESNRNNNNLATGHSRLVQNVAESDHFKQTKWDASNGNLCSTPDNANFSSALPPLPPKPLRSSFQRMHHIFDPSQRGSEKQLVSMENVPEVPQKIDGDVGIYGESFVQRQNIGFRGALLRAKHGTSIANPNYGDRLGTKITDPTFVRPDKNSAPFLNQESDYEFAEDVPVIPSISGDDEDYETPLSPVWEGKRLDDIESIHDIYTPGTPVCSKQDRKSDTYDDIDLES